MATDLSGSRRPPIWLLGIRGSPVASDVVLSFTADRAPNSLIHSRPYRGRFGDPVAR